MKAKCKKCGDTVEVTRLREYKTCKCGAIGLDYGDGYYCRVCGNPEDFGEEIEGLLKPRPRETRPVNTNLDNTDTLAALEKAVIEAKHYITMDTDTFSVSVGDIEIIRKGVRNDES